LFGGEAMSVIQFPIDEKARLEILNKIIAKRKKRKVFRTSYTEYFSVNIPGLYEIKCTLESVNDTLKYVTDGLYMIAVELKDTREQIEKIVEFDKVLKDYIFFQKKFMVFCIVFLLTFFMLLKLG